MSAPCDVGCGGSVYISLSGNIKKMANLKDRVKRDTPKNSYLYRVFSAGYDINVFSDMSFNRLNPCQYFVQDAINF